MKYIIFDKPNKYHFLFLSFFIIKFIDELIDKNMISTKDIVETFHKNYLASMSDFLSIIPIIIIKARSKGISKDKLINENNKDIEYIYSDINADNNRKRTKRIIKFSIIISIFEFLGRYINIFFKIIFINYKSTDKNEQNSIILINIISKLILSILILHYPFYRHHYVSLGINIIFLILLIILDIVDISKVNGKYAHLITKAVRVILYSFEDVFAKILLSFDSISAYIYLFYRGIIVNSLAVLFTIVFIFVKIPDEKGNESCVFSRFWKVYEYKINILYYFIQFFNEYLTNLNIFLIIDKFSPNHYAMASIISNFSGSLVNIIYNPNNVEYFFIKLALYILLIITTCIYIEFVILNFCGLEKYTKLFLQKEANKDIQQTNLNRNDSSSLSERESAKNLELNSIEENNSNDVRESKSSDIEE